ncbi:MAG: helix-turn-helix transcriptional regulator [Verrucomicrobiae bacterium]|nr:helix-turn-helix transcriptional regulator [Verrucomicrobiae bacterium]
MQDYFRYFASPPDPPVWGLGLAASGFTTIPPKSPYPPAEHPENHALLWSRGRVIEALQVVMISAGEGVLETRPNRPTKIEAGMVFLLFPDAWHRYRPNPETGWVESWIEVCGPVVDALLPSGAFRSDPVLRHGVLETGIEETLNRIHVHVVADQPDDPAELAALAMQVLAQCARASAGASPVSNIQRAVHRAERYLSDHFSEPLQIESLVKIWGVSYSHFRRAFRTQTGYTPWGYVVHLRLTRARALMAASDSTLEDIASQTGFSSGFHLSSSFKKAYGMSPDPWRKDLAERSRSL